uniref:Ribonuclease H1 n=1 Tax=Caligus rogercresseyi TaxID=217165 RepID=C1BQD0_CALRO|nr:Ribonuclease H1 [Caligus rogercresseyi]
MYKKFDNIESATHFIDSHSAPKEHDSISPKTHEVKSSFFSGLWNQTESTTTLEEPIKHAKESKFYAVSRGHKCGIFKTWDECRTQIAGYDNPRFQKFSTQEEAELFINFYRASKLTPGFSVSNRDWQYNERLGYSMNKDGWVKVFTDGACIHNGRGGASGGIGIFFWKNSHKNTSEPLIDLRQTNNVAELTAISRAIHIVKSDGLRKIAIYTDSQFAIDSIEFRMPNWKKQNWTRGSSGEDVRNKSEFLVLDDIMKNMTIKFIYVPGHRNIYGNNCADKLARRGSGNTKFL